MAYKSGSWLRFYLFQQTEKVQPQPLMFVLANFKGSKLSSKRFLSKAFSYKEGNTSFKFSSRQTYIH